MSASVERRLTALLFALSFTVIGLDSAAAVQRHAAPQPTAAPTQTQPQPAVRLATVRISHHHAVPVKRRGAARQQQPARTRQQPKPAPRRPARTAHRIPARPHVRTPRVTGPTGWRALDLAIARIPTYRPGAAIWLVSNRYGHWGTADWYHATLYIGPDVPTNRLYDVAVHEWSHELSVLDYGGDVEAAVNAMNTVFGGGGLTGAERAADCMAKLQGAAYTHYTSCTNKSWRRAAGRLLRGNRL